MIKCKIGSDGRKYLKTGLRKRKKYSNEKAELCFDELFHYLLDKENTEKKAKDCSFHLEINLFKKTYLHVMDKYFRIYRNFSLSPNFDSAKFCAFLPRVR